MYTHFSHIIKATLSLFIHFLNPSATSVVNTWRECLPVFTTYPISHRHSLTTKVSIIPYPHAYLLLLFRTLPIINTPLTLGISTQPIPHHYILPHNILPKPISHYSCTRILPYPTIMVEVNKQQKKNDITIKIRPK